MPRVLPATGSEKPYLDEYNPGGQRHILALDGLRGLAILLILYIHLFTSNIHTGNHFYDFFGEIRASSWIGVNFFFALSGFLITGILRSTLNHGNYFKIFYARRSLRIFPLFYGFLFLILVLTKPLHLHWNGWQYYHLTYTANLALWRYNVPLMLSNFNINHFWSLDVEEQFYLVWPFVVYRIRNATRLITVSLCTCLAILLLRIVLTAARSHFANPYLTYSFTPSCADNLLFGSCLALALRTEWRERVLHLAPKVFLVCAAITTAMFFYLHGLDIQNNLFVPTLGFTIIGIMGTALIAMTLEDGSTTQRIFKNPALRFFGRYSYGLYVYHYSIYETVNAWLHPRFDQRFHSKALSVLLVAFIAGVFSVAVAVASFHLFEIHFLKLKKYFPYASKKAQEQPV